MVDLLSYVKYILYSGVPNLRKVTSITPCIWIEKSIKELIIIDRYKDREERDSKKPKVGCTLNIVFCGGG